MKKLMKYLVSFLVGLGMYTWWTFWDMYYVASVSVGCIWTFITFMYISKKEQLKENIRILDK